MGHEISVDETASVVEVRFQGLTGYQELLRGREGALARCLETDVRRILLDLSAAECSETLGTVDLFDYGQSWRDLSLGGGFSIASVLPGEISCREDMAFFVTVASNRGVRIKAFETRDEALQWLCS